MLLENMTTEQRAKVVESAKEIHEYLKNPNAEIWKDRFEQIKPLSLKERYEITVDYVFQLFGESEELTAENKKLQQQVAAQQLMIEQLEQKLTAIGSILNQQTEVVPEAVSA